MNTDELNAAIVNREGQILTLRGEIAKLKNFIVERHGVVGGLMMDVARLLAEADAAARAAPGVPADVLAAVDRMCMPLDPSMLGGVTAEEDARCMAKIKRFIDGLAAPAAPLPNNEAQAQAAEAKLYRDLTGDVVRLGFGGLAEAVASLAPPPVAPRLSNSEIIEATVMVRPATFGLPASGPDYLGYDIAIGRAVESALHSRFRAWAE